MWISRKKIDRELLHKQKAHLLEILGNENSNITAEQHKSIEGIISLINHIQHNIL